jgi:hypothetical protein
MREVCSLIWLALVGAFRSRVSLEAENTILRHQLSVLRRKSPKRPTFGMLDRLSPHYRLGIPAPAGRCCSDGISIAPALDTTAAVMILGLTLP